MTKLEIWNRALAMLPHDRRVTSPSEDSTEALRCRDHWDAAKCAVLAAHDWGWATVEAAHSGVGCRTVARPGGALRVTGLFGADGRRVRATAANGVFRAGEAVAGIRYVPELGDETADSWPRWFAEAVAAELALRIAGPILGNVPRQIEARAANALAEAKRIDASETAWMGTDGKTIARARR